MSKDGIKGRITQVNAMRQPSAYQVDRATAQNDAGDRVECVVLVLACNGREDRYVLPKEDAVILAKALYEAALDAKRLIDVSRGVGT